MCLNTEKYIHDYKFHLLINYNHKYKKIQKEHKKWKPNFKSKTYIKIFDFILIRTIWSLGGITQEKNLSFFDLFL